MSNKKPLNFRKLLEEVTSGDIATVDSKMGTTPDRRKQPNHKGKKCKRHKRMNCQECLDEQDNH